MFEKCGIYLIFFNIVKSLFLNVFDIFNEFVKYRILFFVICVELIGFTGYSSIYKMYYL